jgi:8-oxo-dGTP pyrophosphatase MutT (NUDIX family)
VSTPRPTVQAAGGVVTRYSSDRGLEFLVVHRPRYDDWSLPKGKLEDGESIEDAARREVLEETGMQVKLGAVLPNTEYVDRHGRPKVVHYWIMTVTGSAPWQPSDEVDEVRWMSSDEAATLLSYEHDRRLVATVDAAPPGGTA